VLIPQSLFNQSTQKYLGTKEAADSANFDVQGKKKRKDESQQC